MVLALLASGASASEKTEIIPRIAVWAGYPQLASIDLGLGIYRPAEKGIFGGGTQWQLGIEPGLRGDRASFAMGGFKGLPFLANWRVAADIYHSRHGGDGFHHGEWAPGVFVAATFSWVSLRLGAMRPLDSGGIAVDASLGAGF